MEMEDKESWRLAMDTEMATPKKNDKWDLVLFPKGWKPIRCKWLFKNKIGSNGSVEEYTESERIFPYLGDRLWWDFFHSFYVNIYHVVIVCTSSI